MFLHVYFLYIVTFILFSYNFFIRVSNAAGSTDSPSMSVLTSESAPLQILPPAVYTVAGQYGQLSVQWLPPAKPNGLIRNYILQRNSSTPWNFAANSGLNFTDQGLTANTVYSYAVTACTGGGCTSSLPTSAKTLESSPNYVIPPLTLTLNSTAISISWTRSGFLNMRPRCWRSSRIPHIDSLSRRPRKWSRSGVCPWAWRR